MCEREGVEFCHKCNREVLVVYSGSGQKWFSMDCEHNNTTEKKE